MRPSVEEVHPDGTLNPDTFGEAVQRVGSSLAGAPVLPGADASASTTPVELLGDSSRPQSRGVSAAGQGVSLDGRQVAAAQQQQQQQHTRSVGGASIASSTGSAAQALAAALGPAAAGGLTQALLATLAGVVRSRSSSAAGGGIKGGGNSNSLTEPLSPRSAGTAQALMAVLQELQASTGGAAAAAGGGRAATQSEPGVVAVGSPGTSVPGSSRHQTASGSSTELHAQVVSSLLQGGAGGPVQALLAQLQGIEASAAELATRTQVTVTERTSRPGGPASGGAGTGAGGAAGAGADAVGRVSYAGGLPAGVPATPGSFSLASPMSLPGTEVRGTASSSGAEAGPLVHQSGGPEPKQGSSGGDPPQHQDATAPPPAAALRSQSEGNAAGVTVEGSAQAVVGSTVAITTGGAPHHLSLLRSTSGGSGRLQQPGSPTSRLAQSTGPSQPLPDPPVVPTSVAALEAATVLPESAAAMRAPMELLAQAVGRHQRRSTAASNRSGGGGGTGNGTAKNASPTRRSASRRTTATSDQEGGPLADRIAKAVQRGSMAHGSVHDLHGDLHAGAAAVVVVEAAGNRRGVPSGPDNLDGGVGEPNNREGGGRSKASDIAHLLDTMRSIGYTVPDHAAMIMNLLLEGSDGSHTASPESLIQELRAAGAPPRTAGWVTQVRPVAVTASATGLTPGSAQRSTVSVGSSAAAPGTFTTGDSSAGSLNVPHHVPTYVPHAPHGWSPRTPSDSHTQSHVAHTGQGSSTVTQSQSQAGQGSSIAETSSSSVDPQQGSNPTSSRPSTGGVTITTSTSHVSWGGDSNDSREDAYE
jgi:hypothetical protein